MKKFAKWLDNNIEEIMLVTCLTLIILVSFAQVILRKLPFAFGMTWGYEFCRSLWIISVYFSLPFAIKKGSMLSVDVLRNRLSENAKEKYELAIDIVTALVMALMAVLSFKLTFARIESMEMSAAMRLPIYVLYAFMSLGYLLAVKRAGENIHRRISRMRRAN